MINLKLFYNDKVKSGLNFRPLAVRCCNSVLAYERYPFVSEVSLTLVSDAEIRALNRRYRGVDRPTDVLSFLQGNTPDCVNPDSGAVILGDIVISAETAVRQAKNGIERELAMLTVHGMLHLLGYDHAAKSGERDMFGRQERVLQKLGFGL